MVKRHLITLLLLMLSLPRLCGGERCGVLLYDVGRLYDTIPSPHYDDSRYTPSGLLQWSGERYDRKVRNICSIIDSLEMPIVILYGVENLEVVRDIQRSSRLDYSSKHRTLDYYSGLDFALLYYGDILSIEEVSGSNSNTYIGGELLGHTIAIHLTRRGDRLLSTLPPNGEDPAEVTIAWGNLSQSDIERLQLSSPLQSLESRGGGDSYSSTGWYLKSRIGLKTSHDIQLIKAGVYISDQLLDGSCQSPLPTYSKSNYIGGYSSHLPQYIIFDLER